jgi:hypothetical protein
MHYFFTTFLNEHNFKVKSELIMRVGLLCNYINKITKVINTPIKYLVLWYCSSGFQRHVHSSVDANISEKHTVSIFRTEGDSMFLQNVGIYQKVDMAPKPRTTVSSSPLWKPQISLSVIFIKRVHCGGIRVNVYASWYIFQEQLLPNFRTHCFNSVYFCALFFKTFHQEYAAHHPKLGPRSLE